MKKISYKRKILCIILILILAADIAFIFYNSSENGGSSDSRSDKLTRFIFINFCRDYDALSDAEREDAVLKANSVIRELAHMAEFIPFGFSLSALLFALYLPEGRKNGKLSLISLLCGALYALSDEIHQIFVDGRGFQFFDIFMDSCGCTLGIIISLIIYVIIKKHYQKRRCKRSVLS